MNENRPQNTSAFQQLERNQKDRDNICEIMQVLFTPNSNGMSNKMAKERQDPLPPVIHCATVQARLSRWFFNSISHG